MVERGKAHPRTVGFKGSRARVQFLQSSAMCQLKKTSRYPAKECSPRNAVFGKRSGYACYLGRESHELKTNKLAKNNEPDPDIQRFRLLKKLQYNFVISLSIRVNILSEENHSFLHLFIQIKVVGGNNIASTQFLIGGRRVALVT